MCIGPNEAGLHTDKHFSDAFLHLLTCPDVSHRPYNCNQVRLHTDKETGKPKGFAHVHFPNADSLDRCGGLARAGV